MKVLYVKKSIIYKIFIFVLLILILIIFFVALKNKNKETFNEDPFYKGNVNEKIIAFTCNVDWGDEYILNMLDIFDKYDAKITFFITGKWAEKNEDMVIEIYRRGHEIGNHGYEHKDYSMLDYQENKNQIFKCNEILYDIIGVDCKYFAPPAGSYNDNTLKAARDLNCDVILWSIDTIDWREDSTIEKIEYRVLSNVHNSGIILIHPTNNTITALPNILKTLMDKGYKIGRVSDVIN